MCVQSMSGLSNFCRLTKVWLEEWMNEWKNTKKIIMDAKPWHNHKETLYSIQNGYSAYSWIYSAVCRWDEMRCQCDVYELGVHQ